MTEKEIVNEAELDRTGQDIEEEEGKKEGRSGFIDGSQSPTFVVVPPFLPHAVMLCCLFSFVAGLFVPLLYLSIQLN